MLPVISILPQNFSNAHPNHPLNHHFDHRDYTCHVCKTSGTGQRYRCHACNVDIHAYCSNSSQELSSFLHRHSLTLFSRMDHCCCDVCRESINDMFYRCNRCNFDVHPLCTQFPEQARCFIDNHHELTLRKPSSAQCSVCETDCSSLWVYNCDVCSIYIHPNAFRSRIVHRIDLSGCLVHPSNGYGYGYGYGVPAHWGYPNYHIGYSPRPNYGGNQSSLPILGSVFSLIENLTASAIVEFIFNSAFG